MINISSEKEREKLEHKVSCLENWSEFSLDFFKSLATQARMNGGTNQDNIDLAYNLAFFAFPHFDVDFGTSHLTQFVRQNQTIDHEILEKYSLVGDYVPESKEMGVVFPSKYIDQKFSFGVQYGERPVAFFGFDVAEEGGIKIKQIQGVEGSLDVLKDFNWTFAAVTYILEWAEINKIPQVLMQSAKNNKWVCNPNFDVTRAFPLYDLTAKRLKYKGKSFTKQDSGDYKIIIS